MTDEQAREQALRAHLALILNTPQPGPLLLHVLAAAYLGAPPYSATERHLEKALQVVGRTSGIDVDDVMAPLVAETSRAARSGGPS